MASKKQVPDKVHVSQVKHDLRKIHKRIYTEAKKIQAHRTIISSERTWHQVFSGSKPAGLTVGRIYGEAAYDVNNVRFYVNTVDGSTPGGTHSVTVTNLETSDSATANMGIWLADRGRIDVDIILNEGDQFLVEFTGSSTYDYNMNAWLQANVSNIASTVEGMEV